MLAGLVCLGWVTYQYFGTNLTAQHSFSTEKDGLRAKWQQEKISTATARNTQSQAKRTPARTVPGDAIALLRIPAFGARYEVPIVTGTSLAVLSRGVGHYQSSAMPGQVGNFAIAGHRITHGQPFARLLELTKGDQIIVETLGFDLHLCPRRAAQRPDRESHGKLGVGPAARGAKNSSHPGSHHPDDLSGSVPLTGSLNWLWAPGEYEEQDLTAAGNLLTPDRVSSRSRELRSRAALLG